MRSLSSLLPTFLCTLALLGCGGDPSSTTTSSSSSTGTGGTSNTGGSGGTGGAPACQQLTPGPATINFAAFTAWVSLAAKVDAPLDGYPKTRLTFELYQDDGSGTLPELAPGSFTLGTGADASYGTCQHCVLLVAYDSLDRPRRAFFQASGTMELTQLDPNDFGVVAGEVRDVHLVEVTQDADLTWHTVPNGLCFDVPSWKFDTRPIDGGPCTSAEDCPNETSQICDIATKTCQPGQCSLTGDPPFCNGDEICLSQIGDLAGSGSGGPAVGACYPTCTPGFAGECGAGKTCLPLGPTQDIGVCLAVGDAPAGAPCASPDVGTGCAEGAVCVGEVATCAPLCNYLSAESGCPQGTYCTLTNVCRPLESGDTALAGEPCNSASLELTDCAPEGDAFRGICTKFFPNAPTLTCERLCRTDAPACPANHTCLPAFSNPSVGICHPKPVCGDGVVDVIGGEYCDDHNTTSGDGCNADCTAAELGPLCSKAEPLQLGAFVVSTNEDGIRGYASACDPFNATPTKTYAFTVPGPGRLSLELDSPHALGLSVLGDCADNASELACREEPQAGTTRLHLDFTDTPAKPALVVVRGQSPLDEGLFGLFASFTPAVCGDGQVGGPEVCDDGNTQGGDGCSADCKTIEWPQVCAALPALDTTTANSGDTTNGSTYFDTSGTCGFALGAGLSRAYAFTAPSAGTLSLSLASAADLVLYVEKDCGPVDTSEYVSCSNSGQAGEIESTSVPLTAGEHITVIVAGFSDTDAGAFTLSASFAP